MKKANEIIKARKTTGGWIKGTIGTLNFEAKVYNEGSEYGIFEGRVSKLAIWDEQKRRAGGAYHEINIATYDRDWDILPETDEEMATVEAVIDYLEALPTEKSNPIMAFEPLGGW